MVISGTGLRYYTGLHRPTISGQVGPPGGPDARCRSLGLAVVACLCASMPLRGQGPEHTTHDAIGDAVARRADAGADGPVDAQSHRLPDVVSHTIGPWQPLDPSQDLFEGGFSYGGEFFRLDIVFDGLVNPPGTTGCCDVSFAPFLHGEHPVFGYVEIDMDANVNTGGELELPRFTYLGNAARFGGLPTESRFRNRVARDGKAFDGDITTPPFVDRSGEDFHIALQGWEIEEIVRSDATDTVFGVGETWVIRGYLFPRAHGYVDFSYACCLGPPGTYEPLVSIQFAHSAATDRTTLSLVYPLTNAGAASAFGDVVEPPDGDPGNQNSVAEALDDLVFGVNNAQPEWPNDSNFAIIEEWGQFELLPGANSATQFLDPLTWEITIIVGTGYTIQTNDALFVWTDVMPDVLAGDFDGNGQITWADLVLFNKYLLAHDGQAGSDADGRGDNCSVEIINFGPDFSLFDVNYDGRVDPSDRPALPALSTAPGDLDSDGDLDQSDFGFLQACMTGPVAVPMGNECGRADLDLDLDVDAEDVELFKACASGPDVPADPMCWETGALRCSASPSSLANSR